MASAKCPYCGARVNVGENPKMGQRFTCQDCEDVSEVVWLNPVDLDWVDEEDIEEEEE